MLSRFSLVFNKNWQGTRLCIACVIYLVCCLTIIHVLKLIKVVMCCELAFQKCAICAILLHGENIWNPGIFVKITFTRKKKTMWNHDWPNFPRDMPCIDRCSAAFFRGYHSIAFLYCCVKYSGSFIRGCKMFPRTCYPIFGDINLVPQVSELVSGI